MAQAEHERIRGSHLCMHEWTYSHQFRKGFRIPMCWCSETSFDNPARSILFGSIVSPYRVLGFPVRMHQKSVNFGRYPGRLPPYTNRRIGPLDDRHPVRRPCRRYLPPDNGFLGKISLTVVNIFSAQAWCAEADADEYHRRSNCLTAEGCASSTTRGMMAIIGIHFQYGRRRTNSLS